MDFHERFVGKSPISNFMEICPVGAMLIHGGQTDMLKLIGTFHACVSGT
jgi:hypothetical protein